MQLKFLTPFWAPFDPHDELASKYTLWSVSFFLINEGCALIELMLEEFEKLDKKRRGIHQNFSSADLFSSFVAHTYICCEICRINDHHK